MYDQLVQVISQFYAQDQAKGIFLTCMNGSATVGSGGVIATDRPRPEVLGKFYRNFSASDVSLTTLICDVVIDIQEVTDYSSLQTIDHDDTGLVLCSPEGQQIGVLLPQTEGIQNLSQGLAYMKQKYQLEGLVNVFVLKTDRKVVVSSAKK